VWGLHEVDDIKKDERADLDTYIKQGEQYLAKDFPKLSGISKKNARS
jgi:hypothetical protein